MKLFFKKILLILIALGCCSSYAIAKQSLQKKKIELKQVTRQIHQIKTDIHSSKNKKRDLIQQLKVIEIRIGKLSVALNKTKLQLQKQQNILDKLQQDHQKQQIQLEQQQILFAKQLGATYQLGKHDYVKLILNQKNPNTLSRQLKYYDYFNHARVNIIKSISVTLEKLLASERHIQLHTAELQATSDKQKQQQDELQTQKSQREVVVKKLSKKILTKQQKLRELQTNKQNLESIVNKLKHSGYFAAVHGAFSKLRGKLPWPLHGSVDALFGTHIQSSQLTYNGVFIKAKQDTPVHAIYPGKIVFSDWLRGFGLLVIVEHNQGFMTLYAHNHNLLKQVGDSVDSGEIIANVGHTGGNTQNGLYFEIRRNGKPISPIQWCNTKNKINRIA